VARLGVTDGFLGNPKVKIPLQPTLRKADKTLRMIGMGKDASVEGYVTRTSRGSGTGPWLPGDSVVGKWERRTPDTVTTWLQREWFAKCSSPAFSSRLR